MPVINRLPQGGGVNAKGFEVTPWFIKGELYNTDIFGSPSFYTQQDGRINTDTYQTDGYIHGNYVSVSYCDSVVRTGNVLPRTYDFALIRLKHVRIASSNYRLAFGTTNSNSVSRIIYRWDQTNATYDYWVTVPLDVFNSLGVNERLAIGGASEFYIYEIYFVKEKV